MTTTIQTTNCPAWCSKTHRKDTNGQDHGEWFHRTNLLRTDRIRVQMVRSDSGEPGWEPTADDVRVYLDVAMSDGLIGDEVRAVSNALDRAVWLRDGVDLGTDWQAAPDTDEAPAWADDVTPWQQGDDGIWRRTLTGTHDGARVRVKQVGTSGMLAQVLTRGPNCPPWCEQHPLDVDWTPLSHDADVDTGIDQNLYLNLAWTPDVTGEPEEPYLHLDATDVCLTPDEAIRLAEVIIAAANRLQALR